MVTDNWVDLPSQDGIDVRQLAARVNHPLDISLLGDDMAEVGPLIERNLVVQRGIRRSHDFGLPEGVDPARERAMTGTLRRLSTSLAFQPGYWCEHWHASQYRAQLTSGMPNRFCSTTMQSSG